MDENELKELLNKSEEELYELFKNKDKKELDELQRYFTKKGKVRVALNVVSKIQKNKHNNSVLSEGLAKRTEENLICIDDIKENPNQVRKIYSDKEVREKADSINALGLITPITVYKDEKGDIYLIAGQLRLLAYFLLREEQGDRFDKIEVKFRSLEEGDYNETNFRKDALTENIVRSDMHIIDIAKSLKESYDVEVSNNPKISYEEFGKIYGKGKSYVFDYLKIASILEEQKELAEKIIELEVDSRRLILAVAALDVDVDKKTKIVQDYIDGRVRIVDVENMLNKKETIKEKKIVEKTLLDEVLTFSKEFKKSNYKKLKAEDKKDVDSKLETIKKLMDEIKERIN
jgi:ParB family chromosome partitioning protein